ncbi:Short-chain dehydrogenase/reductase family protein [Mycena indigotica]|uniref:Short-chain dehydrogenase/reductase family protein n=1 Tax=Mycena indigotica TaxID=2126181 RepID=A0A8H6SHK9_9AGAR|nr:Short-chain dehydrogenase/reductase family protein [Mycena indigotica]KAF7299494.1 Short-chain dehydrogenase/reductase family protein [Mycena indigotica]
MTDYPIFSFETTADEVATAFSSEIKGKNVLITGTSLNGIGFEAALAISKYANLVIITGYNDERLKLSEDAIKKEVPGANVRRLVLDLSSLAAVRQAAVEINAYTESLHVVVHNAAAPIARYKRTVDGLENQIAVAHVGPFLLTKLILPKVLASTSETYTPRVVFVASSAHKYGQGVNLELLKTPDESKHHPGYAYLQAKSANILTAIELARRANGKLLAFSLHPGIIDTNFNQKDDAIPVLQSLKLLDANGKPNTVDFKWKTIPQGAATTVAAAFDPRITADSGAYLDDSKIATQTVSPHSTDPANAERLWTATEEVIGEKFEL